MAGLVVHLIPHTHWDREWYLTRAGFLARLVPMLDDLLARLEHDPAFRSFLLDGQTVLLEDYLRVRPEQRDRVTALVRAGRLQVGPWYVLADELIPSGESLVRNLLVGAADAARLGGRLDVLYSPDAFGHPAALPWLASQFGLRHAVLWRGLGGEPGQEGDLFRWRAPQGGDVLVYHLPPDGYEVGATIPAGWSGLRAALVARARTRHVAVPVGADHHAAHPALSAARDAIARAEPDADVLVSRLDEFLRAAEAEAGALPLLEGELRWSYGYTWTLQGVHGTRARLKRRHSLAELALERAAEPLAALALALRAHEARPLLREAWRTLLRSQFHDSIAGCTADDVARRVEARVEDAATTAAEVSRACFDALAGHDPDRARDHPEDTRTALVFWNPAARARDGVVVADLSWFRRDVLVGPPGHRRPRDRPSPSARDVAAALAGLPHQLLGRSGGEERLDAARHYPDQDEVEVTRVAVVVPTIPALALHSADVQRDPPAAPEPVVAAGRRLENGLVRVEVARNGTAALTDLATGARHVGLLALESEGDVGDGYTWAAPPGDVVRRPTRPARVLAIAGGPLVGALEVSLGLECGRPLPGERRGRVDLRLVLSLYAGSPTVRCTVELENRALDHRLRLRLPAAAPGETALAGGAFGTVRRPRVDTVAGGYSRETPVATAPAHRFVAGAVPSAAGGVALLAPGFFEYEHAAGGDLLVTLFRAFGRLSRDDLPTRRGHAAWPTSTPLAQSPGDDRLQLALHPLGPSIAADGDALARAWEDAFLPIRGIWLRQALSLSPPAGGIALEGRGLVLSAVKPAADGAGLILRCYNALDEAVEGRWQVPFEVTHAARVRADEREPQPLEVDATRRAVAFDAGPRAVVTVLLGWAPVERELDDVTTLPQ